MPKVKCNRCLVSYDMRMDAHKQSKGVYICEVPRCTRRYREDTTNEDNSVQLYQTRDEVSSTIHAAVLAKENGNLVDNGGSQEKIGE